MLYRLLAKARRPSLLAGTMAAALLSLPGAALALPGGGVVVAGSATISAASAALTVNQLSQNAVVNWQSFSIGTGESVTFAQPNAQSVTLNRVLGQDPSAIMGKLSANGRVFIVNPNGIIFGRGAQVNVGGLVASALGISDGDFMANRFRFNGTGGSVRNDGTITADGGVVALMGSQVSNQGTIQAQLGTVALVGGEAVTLDFTGDGLLNVAVERGAMQAIVENGGLIAANGGRVLLTAQAAGQMLKTAVNNTGVIVAQTVANRGGVIMLLGDMDSGTMNINGSLDAAAPDGGNGGFIETSAATVNIADTARITTLAPGGTTGTWLIDPQDFTIQAGTNISGAALSALLVTNSIVISTLPGNDATVAGTPPVTNLFTSATGNGDIFVNEAIAWTATPSTTTLRLNAVRDININAAITATNGNVVLCCGRDVNVAAAMTTTNGSISINGGRNVTIQTAAALTVTDGNMALCAGHDLIIQGALVLTRGTTIPAQALGLGAGMTLIAGFDGTGPGAAGGTVIFGASAPPIVVTGPAALVTINYNPVSYAAPINFAPRFTLSGGTIIDARMLVFPKAEKVADGTTAVVLSGFNSKAGSGLPTNVTLVAGPNARAAFDSALPGEGGGVSFSGYTLGGPDAARYALASSCCEAGQRTTGTVTPTPTPPPPPTPTPTPAPTPTPTPISTRVPVSPISTTPIAAIVTGMPIAGVQFAVFGGGVRMPAAPVAAVPAPIVEVAPAPAAPQVPAAPPPLPQLPPRVSRH